MSQENSSISKKEAFRKWKEESTKSRHEAMTYIDLAKGESMKVQVLIEQGVSIEEIKSEKGDFKKVTYKVLDLKSGHTLDLRLTPRQSAKLEDEVEKLVIQDYDPVIRLKKVDDKTLDIEAVYPNE